jgi:hypothetical protein
MIDATDHTDLAHFLHQANGKVYKADPAVYEDDGRALKVLIQTSRFDNGTAKLKFLSRLEVLGDFQDTTSNLNVYWSDDDYKTWSSARTVDLSARSYLYRCGSFRKRAFRFYSEADTPLRLEAIELEIANGVH